MRLALLLFALCFMPDMSLGQIVRPQELRLQYHRAERAFRTGSSLSEAKSRLDTVIEALPDDVEALMLRGEVLLAMGRPEAAVLDAQRAISEEPENGVAYLLLCESQRASGAVTEAVAALERAGALIDSGADLHIRLSYNAQMLGDLDQAEAFGRLALAQDESLPGTYLQLARVFQAKGRPEAASVTLASGLEKGIVSTGDLLNDPVLSSLRERDELSRWFRD